MKGKEQTMKQSKRFLVFMLAVIMLFSVHPALAEEAEEKSAAQALIERMVISYAAYGERDAQALEELAAADAALGAQWAEIMALWEAPVTVNEALPEDLPQDDTLCLVSLGFQLNPDGTMREELVERLKVLLAASQQYPKALLVCTGGGTAANDPTATEAGKMAEWLKEQGVDASRIYVEDQSLTTAQNAIFTFDILEKHCPQVKQIAIISSDYHIATGALLFGAEAILRGSAIAVTSNASWHAPTGSLSPMFQAGALIELSGDVKTAFDIYYETYDIHELPPLPGAEEAPAAPAGLTLDKVVVLSRHNIRSPLSGSGSLLGDITPHTWFNWTSNPSELSLRGAMLETIMGQYFRLWLEKEGLFPENYRPEENAVRFYANAKQRTLATARYFSAGLLPVAEVSIESHTPYDTMDPTFTPALNFVTDEYARDVEAQVAELGGLAGIQGIHAGLEDAIALLMDVTDMAESEAYRAGTYGDLLSDETALTLKAGNEPGMKGPIKTATSVADALTLQYYEEPDALKAAFGHELTEADWQKLHTIVDTYTEMLFTVPLVSVNVAHPLLQEIRAELAAEGRKFSFLCGHDSNVASVLAALGVEEYLLPDTVEQHTPIGVKLVFERWVDGEGAAYYQVNLVYQSTDQLRGITPLTLENPPVKYTLHFAGANENAFGMLSEADLLAILDGAIEEYDALLTQYGAEAELDNAA